MRHWTTDISGQISFQEGEAYSWASIKLTQTNAAFKTTRAYTQALQMLYAIDIGGTWAVNGQFHHPRRCVGASLFFGILVSSMPVLLSHLYIYILLHVAFNCRDRYTYTMVISECKRQGKSGQSIALVARAHAQAPTPCRIPR